jgi:hypothetical protein
MSTPKELNYFSGPGWKWGRGLDWYSSHFAGANGYAVRGESSPSYTMHPWVPGVPERIRGSVPDARLIYLVRDPIERMVSQYVHHRTCGYTRKTISELFSVDRFEESDYVLFSRYAFQLGRYLQCFPESQILVVAHEDLLSRRDEALTRVFRFLGVDEGFRSEGFSATYNTARDRMVQRGLNRLTRGRINSERFNALARRLPPLRRLDAFLARPAERPDLAPALRDRLASYVSDDAARLREMTGQAFESWSV